MKSYNSVYNNQRRNAINEQRSAIDNDRARLIAAIKKEYGINDFSSLDESSKGMYKNMINEMWTKENGLTEKGTAFVNEAAAVLTPASDEEAIHKFVTRTIKANADAILQCAVSGKECKVLSDLKATVEQDTKKKLSKKNFVKWIGEIIIPVLSKKVNAMQF